MSATVPSGDSQTIGSGKVRFDEPLNVAGEYNVRGELNIAGPVTGTHNVTFAVGATRIVGGSFTLNTVFSAPSGGGADGTIDYAITTTGIRAGADVTTNISASFDGIRAGATALPATPAIAFSAPPGGGADGTIDYAITTTGIRAGADVTTNISASFDGIRAGATALPTTPAITFTSDKSGAAQANLALANAFTGIRAGADGTVTPSIDIVTSEPIIAGTFVPTVATPLTIDAGRSVSVAPGTTTADAPINVAGTLNISGEVSVFAEDSSIIFSSDKGGAAQANFAPTLEAAVQTQTAQPFTQPLTPTLSASGDNEPLGTQETSGIFLAQPDYDGNIAPPGVQAYTFTPGMKAVSAESDVAPVFWQVTINQTEVLEDVFDVEVVDTVNPFGSYAVIYADDVSGQSFEKFTRGTRVDIAYSDNQGITFENRFTGYVVESREFDEGGADTLEVECYTFDQFLRRNTVSNDQTGNTISQALIDIIQNDTPVKLNTDNIVVGSDSTLSRSYQGEPVEEVLRALSFKSVNEEFGVNDDVEFFFRPRETEHNERGIDNTQWLNYDIPELGKDAVNEVTVFFDDGDRSVTVDDGNDQLNLQEGLELASAGKQSVELSRPDVVTVADAEDEGRRYLNVRNNVLTGEITTFRLFDAKPGDTIDVEIIPRGIDSEFRIAEIRYNWAYDETDVVIVEKRGDTDDVLFRISDSVKRLETQDVDRTSVRDKILKNDYEVLVDVVDNDDNFSEIKVTNTALNMLRDGVINEETITIDEVRWGDDNTNLSRTNVDLEGTEVASFSAGTGNWQADVSVFNTLEVSYESSETADAKEVGLFDDGGNLLLRAVSDTDVRANEIDFKITFTNSDDAERTLITETGLQLFRDILADNDPSFLEKYIVGEGNPDGAGFGLEEDDTDLDNRFTGSLGEVELGSFFIDQFNTVNEWESVFVPTVYEDDFPIGIFSGQQFGQASLLQNGYYIEAEQANNGITGSVANWSSPGEQYGSRSVNLRNSGEFVEHQFFLDPYQHRADKMTVHAAQYRNNFTGDFKVSISVNGGSFVEVRSQSYNNSTGGFTTFGSAFLDNFGFSDSDFNPDNFPTAMTIAVRAEVDNVSNGQLFLDFLQVNDELDRRGIPRYRKLSPYDPEAYGFNAGNLLSEHNPVTLEFNQITSPIEFNQLTVDTEVIGSDFFVDVEGPEGNFDGPVTEFQIEASNDGGQTYITTQNETNPTFDFSQQGNTIDLKVTLDGYWDRGNTGFEDSPPTSNKGMDLDKMTITVGTDSLTRDGIGGVNARAIFKPQTITAGGDFVTEGGLFDTDGNMVCRTIAIAPFDPGSDTRVSTDDTIRLVGV